MAFWDLREATWSYSPHRGYNLRKEEFLAAHQKMWESLPAYILSENTRGMENLWNILWFFCLNGFQPLVLIMAVSRASVFNPTFPFGQNVDDKIAMTTSSLWFQEEEIKCRDHPKISTTGCLGEPMGAASKGEEWVIVLFSYAICELWQSPGGHKGPIGVQQWHICFYVYQ